MILDTCLDIVFDGHRPSETINTKRSAFRSAKQRRENKEADSLKGI